MVPAKVSVLYIYIYIFYFLFFKYCVDVENCSANKGFDYIYIYIYRLVFALQKYFSNLLFLTDIFIFGNNIEKKISFFRTEKRTNLFL